MKCRETHVLSLLNTWERLAIFGSDLSLDKTGKFLNALENLAI